MSSQANRRGGHSGETTRRLAFGAMFTALALIFSYVEFLIPLPVPSSIYGIILLFLALEFKIVKLHQVKETSSFLVAILPIMFLPPAVGVIESWDVICQAWLPYVVVTLVSTVVVMAVSGRVTQRLIRRGGRK